MSSRRVTAVLRAGSSACAIQAARVVPNRSVSCCQACRFRSACSGPDWHGCDLCPELCAPAFLFRGHARFMAVDVNVVGVDAHQEIGSRFGPALAHESGFQSDGKQQQRMSRGDGPGSAVGAEESGGGGIARDSGIRRAGWSPRRDWTWHGSRQPGRRGSGAAIG